jgi:hypothetical protein
MAKGSLKARRRVVCTANQNPSLRDQCSEEEPPRRICTDFGIRVVSTQPEAMRHTGGRLKSGKVGEGNLIMQV